MLSAGFLTACGGAPTDPQMNEAMALKMKQQEQATDKAWGKGSMSSMQSMAGKVKGIRKVGCKEDGEKAYKCDVEMEMEMEFLGGVGSKKMPVALRFLKGSEGWMVGM